MTTMNPLYTAEEIAHQLQDAGASFIITIPLFADKVKQASGPGIRKIFVVGEAEACEPLSALLADDGEDFPENVEINPKDDIACLPYSSGTTGAAKGVMLTHYNLIANASIVTHKDFMWDKDDPVILGLLPFFHSFGQVISMSCALFKGGKVVCVPKFEPESFLKIIQEHKVGPQYHLPSFLPSFLPPSLSPLFFPSSLLSFVHPILFVLSPSKTRKHVARNICGHMFPQCFLVLTHGKYCFQ